MLSQIGMVAREAGQIALRHQKALSPHSVTSKGHLDLVTMTDREVEHFIGTRLG